SLGAAWSMFCAATIATPAYLWQLRRSVGFNPLSLLRVVARPVIASAVMVLAIRMLMPPPGPVGEVIGNTVLLLAAVALGVVTYISALALVWFASGRPIGVESAASERVRLALARLRSRS